MSTSTLTAKGQITIPAEIRQRLSLSAGDKVHFVQLDDGSYKFAPANAPMSSIKGIVPKLGKRVTLEDMDDAIAAGAAERAKRK
jgi:AbrB family looped-hinge helix DNA binding protein